MACLTDNAALKLLSFLYCEDSFSAASNAVANQHMNVNTKNIKPLAFLKRKCEGSSSGIYLYLVIASNGDKCMRNIISQMRG